MKETRRELEEEFIIQIRVSGRSSWKKSFVESKLIITLPVAIL